MSVGTFFIVGLLAGFVASKFIIKAGDGLLRDLGLGIAGAVIGGGGSSALSARPKRPGSTCSVAW